MAGQDELLKGVASDFAEAEERAKEAEDLISLAVEAGENMGTQTAQLAAAKAKLKRWKGAMHKRGFT